MGGSVTCPVRPLRDNIVVRRHDFKHQTLEVTGQITHRGTVLAIGPGRRLRRKVRVPEPNAAGTYFWVEIGVETGRIRPMSVQPGDVVEFSNRGLTEVRFGHESLWLLGEQSVYGKCRDADTVGLQDHSAAGFGELDANNNVVHS